jgi:beta-glucanase (GH16 family)
MASLAFLLGMIPSTEKVESADDKLRADFAAFKEFEQSDELKKFLELEKEIKSSDFALRKKKISKKDYPDSPEHHKEVEYETLKSSEKFVWYFKTKKKYPFREIEKWDLTFEEPFTKSTLDKSKWMTRYYWGDKGIDHSYVLPDDKSYIKDEGNFEFYDNKARIVTKEESVEGLMWHPEHGFLKKEFDFSSGLISTAKSFRQKYGVFTAKVKMSPGGVTQAFWMVADKMVPHIDVAKYESGKLFCNYFWPSRNNAPNKSMSKTGGNRYTSDFYIYTLEWSPNKLVWKINGKVFKTQTSGVPQEEMYINFSTHLKENASESGLPTAMEIDWIRVYKLKEGK